MPATAGQQLDDAPSVATDDNGNVLIASRLGATVQINGVNLIEVVGGLSLKLGDLETKYDEMKAGQVDLVAQQDEHINKLKAQDAEIYKQAALIAAQGKLITAQSDALDASGVERTGVEQCLGRLISALSASKPVDKLESCPTADTPAKACIELDSVNNGKIHGHGTSPGSVRIISCDENYAREGPEMVVCTANGAWSQDFSCAGTTTRTSTTTITTTTTVTTVTNPVHSTCLSWYNEGYGSSSFFFLVNLKATVVEDKAPPPPPSVFSSGL